MDVDVVRDAVELAQPSIEAVQRDTVADCDHDVRQRLNLPDGLNLRFLVRAVPLLLHETDAKDRVLLAVDRLEHITHAERERHEERLLRGTGHVPYRLSASAFARGENTAAIPSSNDLAGEGVCLIVHFL